MNTFQPWQDTIPLLAGARPPQRAPLGEQFEASAPAEIVKRSRRDLKALALRLILLLSVTSLDISVGN